MPAQTPSETLIVRGTTLCFGSAWGDVAGCHKHSETRVHGGGGGGTNGNSAPVSISSTVTVVQEFFLKPRDGRAERAIALRGADIPIRDEQVVTMVSVRRQDADSYYWARLVNHTADRWWSVSESRALVHQLGLFPKWRVSALGPLTGFASFFVIISRTGFRGFFLTTVAATIAGIVVGWRQRRERDAIAAQLDAHFTEIVTWTLSAFADRRVLPSKVAGSPAIAPAPNA